MNDTLDIIELSIYLKCSVSVIRKLVRNNGIPFFRIGNRLFFRKESIDLWIKNQEMKNFQDKTYELKVMSLKSEVI